MKKILGIMGVILAIAIIGTGCKEKQSPIPPVKPQEEETFSISPVGAEKSAEFWGKMDKNSEYVATYNKVIDAEFEKIENKSGDTLVYSFKDPEHKAEGVIGLMDFVKGQKDSVRPPEAVIMAAEVTYTDSANNNQDTTLVTPFAFYFNERPQNVEYELFAANETDTVWIGQVWQEKAQEIDWGEFGRCFFRGATMACLGCAYGCRVTATGYFHCLGGCCGVFAVLSALDCAWQQWWDK